MVVVSLAWIPFMAAVDTTLYKYLQAVQAYMARRSFAVFFLGVFVKRINGVGCLTGLIGGFALGMVRLAAEICKGKGMLTEGTLLYKMAAMNYLYFEIYLLAAALVLIIVGSLLTAPPAAEKLNGLTYSTISDKDRKETRAGWKQVGRDPHLRGSLPDPGDLLVLQR